MKHVNQGIFSNIKKFLAQPYPFYYKGKTLLWLAALLFFGSLLFLYFFEPFVVYVPEHKMPYFWISTIHSCTSLVVIALLYPIKFIPQLEERWTIWKELLLIVLFLVLVGAIQFLLRDIVYDNPENWTWRYLYEEIRNTLLIGGLFAVLFTSLNFNRMNAKSIKGAHALNLTKYAQNDKACPVVQIDTQLKSDAFSLQVNNLIFARTEGNYVELFLLESSVNKVLKRATLKELVTVLAPYPNIIKTHRSYLVNLHFVEKVTGNAMGYQLQLTHCEGTIPVARNMIKAFNESLAEN